MQVVERAEHLLVAGQAAIKVEQAGGVVGRHRRKHRIGERGQAHRMQAHALNDVSGAVMDAAGQFAACRLAVARIEQRGVPADELRFGNGGNLVRRAEARPVERGGHRR